MLRYSLGELITRVRNEFALSESVAINDFIKDKINEALLWIVRQNNGRYNWLLKEASLDTAEYTEANFEFTKGSRTATLLSGTVTPRAIIIYGSNHYLVTAVDGTTVTLGSQFLDDTVIDTEYTADVATMYFQLPENFIALETSHQVSDLSGCVLTGYDNQRFQFMRRRVQATAVMDRIYTILPDPIEEESGTQWLAIWPPYDSVDTVHYSYYAMPEALSSIADECPLPLMDRTALLYATLWFVAVSKGFDRSVIYRDIALNDVAKLRQAAEQDDTVQFEDAGSLTLDLSGTRDTDISRDTDYTPSIV